MMDLDRKTRPDLLRRMNERTVFDLTRREGQTSRADLTRLTGMSAPTISKAVANLLNRGLLEEVGTSLMGGMGRPVVVYQLARETVQVLGANLGSRTCNVFSARLEGVIDEESAVSFPTPGTYEEVIEKMAEAGRELMKRSGVTTLGMGLTAPGAVDAAEGKVLFSPNLRLLDGTTPAADLQRELGVDVRLVHDTEASGLAEQFYGVATEFDDFVRIGVYEGFGMTAVIGRKLFQGQRGMAGELGHVTVEADGALCSCGNRGCLETVATDVAFARGVSKRLGREVTPEEAIQLARDGNAEARAELEKSFSYLAIGVAAAINLFNPEAVLVCARMLDGADDGLERVEAMARARALKPLSEGCRVIRTDPNVRRGAVAAIIDSLTDSLGPRF